MLYGYVCKNNQHLHHDQGMANLSKDIGTQIRQKVTYQSMLYYEKEQAAQIRSTEIN